MILTLFTLAAASRLTGYNGAAYTLCALEAVAAVWLIIAGSLTDTLGRMLKVRVSKGQHKNADRLRRNTMILQIALGLAGSLVLLAGADRIASSVFHVQYCTFIIMVLSPVIFLRSISAVLSGYFQGENKDVPAMAAVVLRQIFIFGFSLLFGRMLGGYGEKVSALLTDENFTSMYSGVGIGIAVSVSEAFVVLFLFLIYKATRRRKREFGQEVARSGESFADSVRLLYKNRGLQWLTNFLLFLPFLLGLIFLFKSAAGETAAEEYGIYGAVFWVLCGVCTALITIALIPVNTRTLLCLRRDEQRFARNIFQSGLHVGMVHSLFVSVFLAVMSAQLGSALCPDNAEAAARMLQGGSFTVVFLTVSLYFCRFLMLTGAKAMVPAAVGIADIVYVILVTVLLNTGRTGILSLVYGGLMGLGVLCILLGAFCFRQLRMRPDWMQIILVPGGAAVIEAVVCALIGRLFSPHLGALATVVTALAAGGAIYWVLLLLLRNFREQELDNIPGGKIIRALGQMLRVF